MVRFLISILVSAFISASCSSSVSKEETERKPDLEMPEAKRFALGKWIYKRVLPDAEENSWRKKLNEKIEKTEPPVLYLIFQDDNILVFVNCTYEKTDGDCGAAELNYKVNESGFIEIDAKGEEPLIVKKLGEDEIELEPRVQRGYQSPPLIYFFRRWTRLSE